MRMRCKFLAYMLAGTLAVSALSGAAVRAEGSAANTVYAGGNGSGDNAGTDADSPLSSLYSAQELLPEGGTIIVTSTIYVTDERSYSLKDGVVLKAADTLSGPVFEVAKGGKLNLNNIVIIGHQSVLISNNGVLEVGSGTSLKVADEAKGVGCVYTGSGGSTYVDGVLVAGVSKETDSTEAQTEEAESETDQTESQQSETEQSETDQTEQSETVQSETVKPETVKPENPVGETQESDSQQPENQQPESQQPESEQPESQQPEIPADETQETDEGQTETQQSEDQIDETQVPETKPDEVQETDNTTEAVMTQAVIKFDKAAIALSVHSRDDVNEVLKVSKMYDQLSESEKRAVAPETLKLLESAQKMAAAYNHTQRGVSVYGNLPWYVQFRVSLIDVSDKEEAGLKVLVPYELKLWNMYTDESYALPKGEKVTVTMPVPDVEIDGEFTIFHYKSDGTVEQIKPVIKGNLMSFETDSFSPFSVAGSTVLAGIGVGSGTGSSSENTSESSTQSTSADSNTSNETNNSSSSNGSNTRYSNSAVNTGDNTQIVIFAVIGLAALVIIAVLLISKRKKK